MYGIFNANKDLNENQTYRKNRGLQINSNKTVTLCLNSDVQRWIIKYKFAFTIANIEIKWDGSVTSLGDIFDER